MYFFPSIWIVRANWIWCKVSLYDTHTHRYCIGCSHPLISCFLCFLSSLQWTSQAWTWASRNIILTSTTKSTATCWISKFNTLTDRLSFWVSIKLCFFFIGQTSASSTLSLPSLVSCLNDRAACSFLVVKRLQPLLQPSQKKKQLLKCFCLQFFF